MSNLKLVTCSNPACQAKVFIPGDLPPLATEPCKKCGHPIMMPMQIRQFELQIKIASALNMVLRHNLLHRDIKPGNILFNSENEPKLIDFGLARNVDTEPESTTVTEGTPYYVAPEKIKRERETPLSDMYSLGCTLYHALTGHVPFDAPTVEELVSAHVHTALTAPNLVVPEITQPTSDALVKIMAKNPSDRYLNYDEL